MLKRLSSRDAVAFAALACSLIFVFADQARDLGFQKGHRGWCSANVMGIIEHATPRNGFVGHTLQYVKEDGRKRYVYFDRYPVFFSAAMHGVLNTVELSRGQQINVARQAMNVLFALSLVMAVAFLLELGFAPGLAVGAAALAASGKLLVTYRDMVHFDQAALVGFMTLLWAIARWYRTRNDRLLYFATAFAVCMGRGYASFAVLAVWWTVEAVLALRTSRAAAKSFVLGTATRACVLAIAIGSTCLAYNISVEAGRNQVPWTHVGIVDSATRRILKTEIRASKKQKNELKWSKFAKVQTERFVANAQPFIGPGVAPKSTGGKVALMLLCFAAVGAFIATRKRELRPPMIVAALSGVLWIIAMRGLTAFHDFTIMFLLSGMVLLMLTLIHWVPERIAPLAALLGCAVLVFSTASRNTELEQARALGELYTDDFARIEKKLKPGETFQLEPTELKKIVPGVPYAVGWYLPNNFIADHSAQVVSTKAKRKGAKNLTPKNRKLFLYRE
jgi:hypothetical protein